MALLAYVFFLTKIGQETTQLALRARIQTQLTRKRSHPSHYNVLDKLRLPSASPRGGVWALRAYILYVKISINQFCTLMKEGEQSSPSFLKVPHIII